jgi:hypothetical protein
MNAKTAKKLCKQAAEHALHTALSAESKGLALKHGNGAYRKIYRDLKKGQL